MSNEIPVFVADYAVNNEIIMPSHKSILELLDATKGCY